MPACICRYFQWIAEIQETLQCWKKKFCEDNVNYMEVIFFTNNLEMFKVHPTTLLVSYSNLQMFRNNFVREYEALNIRVLRYIPGQPDAQWCNLLTLLEQYGVRLPQETHDLISRNVVFPEKGGQNQGKLLNLPLEGKNFLLGKKVSLKLREHTTLKELKTIVQELNYLGNKYLDMLVFFKLNKSVLFDTYLEHYLKDLSESPRDATVDIGSSFPPMVLCSTKYMQDVDHMQNLLTALENTSILIQRIVSTTATVTYSDVTAEDKLDLQQLDIEREFTTLARYCRVFSSLGEENIFRRRQVSQLMNQQENPEPRERAEKLKEVRSMLELLLYAKYIETIQTVCEQYSLIKCTSDRLLKELVSIKEYSENHLKITPPMAAQKMETVKEILGKNSKCLDIFTTLSDSATFYQFVKDKEFHKAQGPTLFMQQYQLITAQLQHEEYDEQVLNHLCAAFKVITLFTDPDKTFGKLIEEVTSLNTVNSCKQLETVNSNITMIKLWFSRAEVRITMSI
jgi:hypothetical protein